MYHLDDTIAAIASAAGGAARGILRISGSRAVDVLGAVFRSSNVESLATARRASRFDGILALRGCAERDLELPAVLYLWPGTHSYTRQPLGELHTFGSPPLLAAALRTICNRGARLAEPGEFTLRAFLAGRIDLTQAEAVLGVIDAAGRRDLDVALAQLAGGLTGPLQELRHRLLDLLAHLEAGLDFVEEDIEFIAQAELAEQLAAARREVGLLAERMTQRSSTADVPRIVLVGSPNVGKSSLFNRLSAGAGALVADFPGTTRDYVRAVIHVEGTRCELIDTAGVDVSCVTGDDDEPFIAAGSQPLRAAAQRLTSNERERADLCLFCLDASRAMNSWERAELTAIRSPSVLLVETKADIAAVPRSAEELPAAAIRTSATTGEGLVDLRRAIGRRLQSLARPEGDMVLLTAERAGASLQAAGNALETAIAAQLAGQGEELIAAEVRGALDELGKVVGAVYTDDILDRVFSRFCIGK